MEQWRGEGNGLSVMGRGHSRCAEGDRSMSYWAIERFSGLGKGRCNSEDGDEALSYNPR